ncbi:MAG: hypothetical protein WC735_00635 [Candidatus Paceibacterota bacterium]|jgi:hypothetical protein
MKRNSLYISLAIVICVSLYFFNTQIQKTLAKCPDDYATSEEQLTAMNSWTNNFYDTHPGATLSDWSKARYQFWIDNKCIKAIERYNEAKSGNADSETIKLIKDTIQETVNEHK